MQATIPVAMASGPRGFATGWPAHGTFLLVKESRRG